MSDNNVRTSSSNNSVPTLRPRAKRLISGLDEGDETTFDPNNARPTQIESPLLTPYDTRPASPIPPAHPQRIKSSSNLRNNAAQSGSVAGWNGWGRQSKSGMESPNSFAGIWGSSWNALQGLASEFLGSETVPMDKDKPRVRRPLSKLDSQRSISSGSIPRQWGPSSSTSHPKPGDIGVGTKEEQTAALRAQKRKDMLTRSESSYADSLGKFKRRLSDDRASVSAPPADNEDREALVYLHHVKKDDTLAGITIRYNISANVLRRANRMWPNDKVQVRKVLMLPVDACGVKGKPVSGPEDSGISESESDTLSSLQAEEVPPRSSAIPNHDGAKPSNSHTRTASASTNATSGTTSGGDSAPAWQHDCWVLLPGNTKPTEIGRLPRRAMGYFPPARRKSISYSDYDTPSTSLDLARSAAQEAITDTPPTTTPPRRHARRLSNAANGYFPSYLTGPGGVGTMSKRVHHPGPAQDGLNKLFAKHLPDVAPPRNQHSLYQPEVPLYSDEAAAAAAAGGQPTTPLFGSGATSPAYAQGMNLNIENVGGAIESWVRRMASKAKNPSAGERRLAARASVGASGKGAGDVGDLIEMTNDFEIASQDEDEGDDDDDGDDGLIRGRQGSVPDVVVGGGGGGSSSAAKFYDGFAASARERTGKRGKAD